MDEEILYQRRGITVTPTRLVTDNGTIALAAISAITKDRPQLDQNGMKGLGLLVVGTVVLFFLGQPIWGGICLALAAVAGLGAYNQSKQVHIKMWTTGGQVDWIRSALPEDIDDLVASLNKAIVMRG